MKTFLFSLITSTLILNPVYASVNPNTLPIEYQYNYIRLTPNLSKQMYVEKCNQANGVEKCEPLVASSDASHPNANSCFDFVNSEALEDALQDESIEKTISTDKTIILSLGYWPGITDIFVLLSFALGNKEFVSSLYLNDIRTQIASQKDLEAIRIGITPQTSEANTSIIATSNDPGIAPTVVSNVYTFLPDWRGPKIWGQYLDSEEKYIRNFRSMLTSPAQYKRQQDGAMVTVTPKTVCR